MQKYFYCYNCHRCLCKKNTHVYCDTLIMIVLFMFQFIITILFQDDTSHFSSVSWTTPQHELFDIFLFCYSNEHDSFMVTGLSLSHIHSVSKGTHK